MYIQLTFTDKTINYTASKRFNPDVNDYYIEYTEAWANANVPN